VVWCTVEVVNGRIEAVELERKSCTRDDLERVAVGEATTEVHVGLGEPVCGTRVDPIADKLRRIPKAARFSVFTTC